MASGGENAYLGAVSEKQQLLDHYRAIAATNVSELNTTAEYRARVAKAFDEARAKVVKVFGCDPLVAPLTAKEFGL